MTYATVEASAHSGGPALLFEFAGVGVGPFYLSNVNDTVVWNGYEFLPAAITCSDFTQTGEMRKDALKIELPRDHPFAVQFLGYGPDNITTVTVFRGHIADGDFIVYWKGRVISTRAADSIITIECENVFSSLRRTGLRARYQRTCRHALYSTACGVDKLDFEVIGSATAAAGLTVTVTEAADEDDGWWVGGILSYPGSDSLRLITAHSGEVVTLSRPIPELEAEILDSSSASVKLYPGCDHTMGTNGCSKFTQAGTSNIKNFGGFPWMPQKNPFNSSLSGSIK